MSYFYFVYCSLIQKEVLFIFYLFLYKLPVNCNVAYMSGVFALLVAEQLDNATISAHTPLITAISPAPSATPAPTFADDVHPGKPFHSPSYRANYTVILIYFTYFMQGRLMKSVFQTLCKLFLYFEKHIPSVYSL